MKSGKTRLNVRKEEKWEKGGTEGENETRVKKHPKFPTLQKRGFNRLRKYVLRKERTENLLAPAEGEQ